MASVALSISLLNGGQVGIPFLVSSFGGCQAGVPANVSIDLAVSFPQLRPLPLANQVPDPSSGVPTRPPGAFTVGAPLFLAFL